MAYTFAALDPTTGRRTLLVEVHSEYDPGPDNVLLELLAERMLQRSIYLGLLVTRWNVYVVRWRFDGANFFRYGPLPTAALLEHAALGPPFEGPAQFEQQVRDWLEAIGFSWYTYLWPDAAPFLVPDVVGHLVGAYLEPWPGVLGAYDAV